MGSSCCDFPSAWLGLLLPSAFRGLPRPAVRLWQGQLCEGIALRAPALISPPCTPLPMGFRGGDTLLPLPQRRWLWGTWDPAWRGPGCVARLGRGTCPPSPHHPGRAPWAGASPGAHTSNSPAGLQQAPERESLQLGMVALDESLNSCRATRPPCPATDFHFQRPLRLTQHTWKLRGQASLSTAGSWPNTCCEETFPLRSVPWHAPGGQRAVGWLGSPLLRVGLRNAILPSVLCHCATINHQGW